MRITHCTSQQAGECADALRELLRIPQYDEDGDELLSVMQQIRLRDLLLACEDAERGTPVKTLADVERDHILAVLKSCGGDKSRAASALGVCVKTVYNKLHEYGVAVGEEVPANG